MIKINLLPPEFRQSEGTPLPVFLLILVGFVVAAFGVFALLFMYQKVQENERQLQELKAVENQLKEKIAHRDKLNMDLKEKQAQKDTILSIRKNRILWAKKLHRLASQTPQKQIWWQWIKMNQLDPQADMENGGKLEVNCYQKGVQETTLDNYRDAIMKDKVFWLGFHSMSPPGFKRVPWQGADPSEEETLTYNLTFYLEPPAAPAAQQSKKK